MIYIIYGDDREKATKQAEKILGAQHETIDAENLELTDLPTLFLGQTFFESERKILVKDLLTIKDFVEQLEKYLDTPHEVVLLEQSLGKNGALIRKLSDAAKIQSIECKKPEAKSPFFTFNLYTEALRDGESAVNKLRTIESTESAQIIVGAWNSVATKKFRSRPTDRHARRAIKELARIDLLIKSSQFSENPWPLLEAFLLRLKDL